MQKLLLLNPPGKELYLRDYFCSKISQADYLNHPIDLVYLSGWLRELGRVSLVDAIVDGLGEQRCLHHIARIRPDLVVGLIGSVSWAEDVTFYRRLGQHLRTRIILIGDVVLENRARRLRELPFVEAFLHDFSTPDLVRYLKGQKGVGNMTVREGERTLACPLVRERTSFRLPVPVHELFLGKPYRYPFVKSRQFATVLTEFGCPYRCNFCVMSGLGWKQRPVDNVLEELDSLAALGTRELFFLDQIFGIRKDRTGLLLDEMIRRRYAFGWVCFARPDLVDEESLDHMRRAGCHSLILGLESGSQKVLDGALKDYTTGQVEEGFQMASRQGLRRIATVILGLPEETEETFQETMALLRRVEPDFVSFNVAVPRVGTPLRTRALELGLITGENEQMDQSGRPVSMPTLTLSREQVASMRSRALRDFYFRLSYVGERLKDLGRRGSFTEAVTQLQQRTALLRNHFRDSSGP